MFLKLRSPILYLEVLIYIAVFLVVVTTILFNFHCFNHYFYFSLLNLNTINFIIVLLEFKLLIKSFIIVLICFNLHFILLPSFNLKLYSYNFHFLFFKPLYQIILIV